MTESRPVADSKRIGRNHPIALRRHQRHAGVDQFLLRIEDVERGALTDTSFFSNAVKRGLGGAHLRLGGDDLRLGSFKLAPGLHDQLLGRVTLGIEIHAALAERFLGLTDRRVFRTTLIKRNRDRAEGNADKTSSSRRWWSVRRYSSHLR